MLLFFGRLCWVCYETLPQQIFLVRLFEELGKREGFIPDVLNLMNTYDLLTFLYQWVKSGSFPSKLFRKTLYDLQPLELTKTCDSTGCLMTETFLDFWQSSGEHRRTAMRSGCGNSSVYLCPIVHKVLWMFVWYAFFNLAAHYACSCAITIDTQNNWGTDEIKYFTIYMYLSAELRALPDDDLLLVFLGW